MAHQPPNAPLAENPYPVRDNALFPYPAATNSYVPHVDNSLITQYPPPLNYSPQQPSPMQYNPVAQQQQTVNIAALNSVPRSTQWGGNNVSGWYRSCSSNRLMMFIVIGVGSGLTMILLIGIFVLVS